MVPLVPARVERQGSGHFEPFLFLTPLRSARQIMAKNEGHTVLLAVDGVDQLTLNHVSEAIVEAPVFALRIGVGGLLIPMEELLLPVREPVPLLVR